MHIRTVALLIISTIVVVLLKLQFEYYNLLLPVLLVSIISFQLAKRKASKRNKVTLIVLVFSNLFCLFTPDKFVYRILNSEEYFWSERDLTLSDFKSEPDLESNTTAIVFPKIIGKINKVYNYPSAIVFTSNDSYKSWINSSLFDSTNAHKDRLRQLLDHEKLHLDLTEIYTREAQDSLNRSCFQSPEEKYMILEYFFNKSDSVQDVFDIETAHGIDVSQNSKWETFIRHALY